MTKIFFQDETTAFKNWIVEQNYLQVILLSDANTNGFCVPVLKHIFPFLKNTNNIVIPQGESNKTIAICELIWTKLNDLNASKRTLILNVGGGMISDIGGFCASVFKRGIDFANIPTTLLAQVDACYGGKTGIDFNGIKNNIGTFQHPKAIFISTEFLKSLNQKIVRSGFAEMIKHVLLDSEKSWNEIQTWNEIDFIEIKSIKQALKFKESIVIQDEHDEHIRQSLNFGHTIGHAIESYFLINNQTILHGEAVMLGMMHELYLSEIIFDLPKAIRIEFSSLAQKLFPDLNKNYSFNEILRFLENDKKNNGGIRMSLLKNVGLCNIQTLVTLEQIQQSFDL